ncbi:MADS-box transcription factor 7-like [Panicum miliaceum]|uniref:MADS-box transcription factor 7-like n=1 Tax=Panicum miliaceum TaxID=4540 RepID=A0A3L6PVE7_PANMI|nr:MADS-box transcription factor 7-like [Panicum miliaceum]
MRVVHACHGENWIGRSAAPPGPRAAGQRRLQAVGAGLVVASIGGFAGSISLPRLLMPRPADRTAAHGDHARPRHAAAKPGGITPVACCCKQAGLDSDAAARRAPRWCARDCVWTATARPLKLGIMPKTLEKYQKCSYAGPETALQNRESEQLKSSRNEYLKLKARVENLQRTQRHSLMVSQLGAQTQHMVDQLTELQRKEKMFSEANKCLRRKLEESNQVIWQQAWEHGEPQPEVQHQLQGGNGFFHPVDAAAARGEPTLQIGYPSEALTSSCMTTFLPPWLP